mmetsp:Transcript_13085/g.27713  ORF Transcript_13085/g.27713 Transcript_13085/m.27713 type:complete len:98 (+) Transcript_13085:67-360(+)
MIKILFNQHTHVMRIESPVRASPNVPHLLLYIGKKHRHSNHKLPLLLASYNMVSQGSNPPVRFLSYNFFLSLFPRISYALLTSSNFVLAACESFRSG